jgi:hypothetical protein
VPDVETLQVGDRWINRLVGTHAVLAVNLTRSSALLAGAALARSWRVHHQVVYHQRSGLTRSNVPRQQDRHD